ncbi:TIGR00375 family protein [Seinonella peptonophila]|uniref:TIGR00375 family protein n=1 Tax=Seinonella peptonophila TaxID=112248 RepID=A0A1M4U7J3_9BACL|nr:endonuclease Q family protein [Seinonella peptonophila]SHE52675.1 TIGR00375 family protein [Seinonella peptonophila]
MNHSDHFHHYFADLHIHIGRTQSNRPVKITGSRSLTFSAILQEATQRKGLQLIGIIDAQVPEVQAEIESSIQQGIFLEHPDGGICHEQTTCLLGAEIEIREPGMSPAHVLAYLPSLAQMKSFTSWLSKHMKNVHLSTQRLYQPAYILLEKVEELGGILIPAHIFTPFKSILGSATNSIRNIFPIHRLIAVELGLSSDTEMADQLSELQSLTFLTNSDAHSLNKMGREYQQIRMREASFKEWVLALQRKNNRAIIANYGLNPKLGKYYQTCCATCYQPWPINNDQCTNCGSKKKIHGVADRIRQLADQPSLSPVYRPPYHYQIPLEFLPTVGPKTREKMLSEIGTEMEILHFASLEQISSSVGERIATMIKQIRAGNISLQAGGAGRYGRIE